VRILADVNAPDEYVSALRGDGHDVAYSRDVDAFGPTATDADIIKYVEDERVAVLSTDAKDFGSRDTGVPVFVAPQDMSGGDVRAAVAHVEALPFDPAGTEPIWLTSL
jgi:hypothetical protein